MFGGLAVEIGGKAVGHAAHRPALALLLEGIALGGVDAGVAVLIGGHALAGVAVHPGAGEALHQLGHVIRIGAAGIKIQMPKAQRIAAQEVIGLIRRLQGRIGKAEQRAAQKDADCGPCVQLPDKTHQQKHRQRGGAGQPHYRHRERQRPDAAFQIIKHPPVIGKAYGTGAGAQPAQQPEHPAGQPPQPGQNVLLRHRNSFSLCCFLPFLRGGKTPLFKRHKPGRPFCKSPPGNGKASPGACPARELTDYKRPACSGPDCFSKTRWSPPDPVRRCTGASSRSWSGSWWHRPADG